MTLFSLSLSENIIYSLCEYFTQRPSNTRHTGNLYLLWPSNVNKICTIWYMLVCDVCVCVCVVVCDLSFVVGSNELWATVSNHQCFPSYFAIPPTTMLEIDISRFEGSSYLSARHIACCPKLVNLSFWMWSFSTYWLFCVLWSSPEISALYYRIYN